MSKKQKPLSRTKIRSRQNLLTAFERVFARKPLEKISIREITDTAGYNRSTFYLYFSDIYELADAFEASVLEEVGSVVGGIARQHASLPLPELIGQISKSASRHVGRIYLCSQLPGFQERFRNTLMPIMEAITGIDSSAREHDFLLSLLSAVLLHNITYLHDHSDALPAEDVIRISRRLVTPGLQDLIRDLGSQVYQQSL